MELEDIKSYLRIDGDEEDAPDHDRCRKRIYPVGGW